MTMVGNTIGTHWCVNVMRGPAMLRTVDIMATSTIQKPARMYLRDFHSLYNAITNHHSNQEASDASVIVWGQTKLHFIYR